MTESPSTIEIEGGGAISRAPVQSRAAKRPRRLLTIGHSYCVAVNRRLAHEMAREGGRDWEVTAVAPEFFHGDLRPINTEEIPGELCRLEKVPAFLTGHIHVFFYGLRLREILRERWDIVHCWEEPYIVAGGQVAWWTPRDTPLVFWTGQTISKNYPPPFSMIEKYCIARCAGWTARGENGVAAMLRRGYDRKPHRVMPLGVDLGLFFPARAAREAVRAQLGWTTAGPPVVGFLGRFVEEKGIRTLTTALEQVKTPWCAMFVGGGPLEDYLRSWSARYGERVRIVTDVPHGRVPEYLNAMDIMCAPSETTPAWREVFGRMLVEAFACGVPVIASNSGEIPLVVGDAARIVREGEATELAQAIAEFIEKPALRAEFAARGIERVRTTYAWPIVARRHLEFFDQLLERGAP
ncbi:MAG: glycosyltransferase family 4 protein [Candidatus Binatus sp.]|uniref:glycosyltransferase family 4 protein n=1 Tax=Candidatus Binatus sp. TaxID=2811406 RepID=UPI002727B990|nr:glycosyltransferase family 4 protein [Candidatus Binatus sp.]MDO8431588.1 glycosyltransferase family 4 protein [Candidatus Binatus sp.]